MDILFKLDENPNIRSKPTAGLALVSNACIFANLMNIQFEKDIPEKSKFGQENNRDHRSFN
jgi:hypothetical protein